MLSSVDAFTQYISNIQASEFKATNITYSSNFIELYFDTLNFMNLFSILQFFLSFSSPELIPLNCCQTHFKILMRIDRASNCFNFGSATLNCTVARQVEDRSCPGKFTLFAQIYLLIVFRKPQKKGFCPLITPVYH